MCQQFGGNPILRFIVRKCNGNSNTYCRPWKERHRYSILKCHYWTHSRYLVGPQTLQLVCNVEIEVGRKKMECNTINQFLSILQFYKLKRSSMFWVILTVWHIFHRMCLPFRYIIIKSRYFTGRRGKTKYCNVRKWKRIYCC